MGTWQTYKRGLFEVAYKPEHDKDSAGASVVEYSVLDAGLDKVLNGRAVSPMQDVRAKAIIGEPLGWICQDIAAELQMDIQGLGSRAGIGIRDLVGMVRDCPRNNEYTVKQSAVSFKSKSHNRRNLDCRPLSST